MNDLISRQAAIDDIKAIYEYHDIVTEDRIIDHLKRLLSADAVEVVRCKDCKYMMSNGVCYEFADPYANLSANDFCSRGERKDGNGNG